MALKVKVVIGKIRDETTESSETEFLSRKIYDAISSATSIHAVDVELLGSGVWAVATLVYEA